MEPRKRFKSKNAKRVQIRSLIKCISRKRRILKQIHCHFTPLLSYRPTVTVNKINIIPAVKKQVSVIQIAHVNILAVQPIQHFLDFQKHLQDFPDRYTVRTDKLFIGQHSKFRSHSLFHQKAYKLSLLVRHFLHGTYRLFRKPLAKKQLYFPAFCLSRHPGLVTFQHPVMIFV